MPRFDGTGPNGQGPMTGRGQGNGMGRSFGFGRRRRGFFGCPWCGYGMGFRSQKEELVALEEYKKDLEDELKALSNEIEELKKSNKE